MGRSVVVEPERGPLLAAGGILLATAVAMINARLENSWGHGVHLVVALLAFGLVFWVALRSPLPERPLSYQSALVLSGLALLVFVLLRLAQVLGADNPINSGTLLWTSILFGAVAAFGARRFRSVPCVLLTGLAVAIFVVAFVDKVFSPEGVTTFRWVLFLLAVGFAAAAARLRDRPWPGSDVQAVNVAGLMLISLASTFIATAVITAATQFGAGGAGGGVQAGFGWRAILVLGSLALLGYAAVTRERGPGYIGVASLFLAIAIVATRAAGETIVGWPLVLLLAAGAAFVLGLMPRTHSSRSGARAGGRPERPPPG